MNNSQTSGTHHPPNLQISYCERCRCVHFRTQNVMLDFSKKEFVELTNTMLEIFQDYFDPLELSRLSNLNGGTDGILASGIVS